MTISEYSVWSAAKSGVASQPNAQSKKAEMKWKDVSTAA